MLGLSLSTPLWFRSLRLSSGRYSKAVGSLYRTKMELWTVDIIDTRKGSTIKSFPCSREIADQLLAKLHRKNIKNTTVLIVINPYPPKDKAPSP